MTPKIHLPSSVADLVQLSDEVNKAGAAFYILGEGSNTLFTDQKAPMIIKPNFHGISIEETDKATIVTVGASENWHAFVLFCLKNHINGLENLALIPGSVGAAPVQNIGAYGVEFADYCSTITFFDFALKKEVILAKQQCQFGYRESIFKGSLYNKGLITQVVMTFPKQWQAKLGYQGLDKLPKETTPIAIMEEVIKLREAKLPDPQQLPNAGSFFKNPVVDVQQFEALKARFPKIPYYPQSNGQIKLAAGWLIDTVGLKGGCYKEVGVHKKQALVLVNYGDGSGADIVELAKFIQQQVAKCFAVDITPEVRMITSTGEQPFESLVNTQRISELSHD